MKIPVFVSCPTILNPEQDKARKLILQHMDNYGLEPRALGRTDYPTLFPLREVYVVSKHCSGGIILGFEQFYTGSGVRKRGSNEEKQIEKPVSFPTPWNQLEAGILFGLKLPLLIFKEESIEGGVFDAGVTDAYVHKMPMGDLSREGHQAIKEVFLNWQAKVRELYYKY